MSPGKRRGPEPDHLKLEGDWKKAARKAIQKKRPSGGWPKAEKAKKKG